MKKGSLSHLAKPGAEIAVRVTPNASRNAVTDADGQVQVHVTAVPQDGRANREVVRLLATALGVAKSRLVLVRGQRSRDKVFRLV